MRVNIPVPFNKAYRSGKEAFYLQDVLRSDAQLAGNGKYTKACQDFFESRYQFSKCFMTNSCTDALEMCAILLKIQPGDEVIIPSFTFVSTANAFALRGATIRFADSQPTHPNICVNAIRSLITPKTKAIVVVHYAGLACDMEAILALAHQHQIYVIEDAAQAIEGYYKGKPLGSFGHLSTFSFHETKNIHCGEGGLLVINDAKFIERAKVIWENGTNRTAFLEGKVNRYEWVDIGSSYLPSELNTAFLFGQLQEIELIHAKRKFIWKSYQNVFEQLYTRELQERFPLNIQTEMANAHLFYVVFESKTERNLAISRLEQAGFQAVFHYQSLHKSSFFREQYKGLPLRNADHFSDCLLRLPFHLDMNEELIFRCVEVLLNK